MAQTAGRKLRIGNLAPDFEALSTLGEFKLYDYVGQNWAIILFFPDDFAPVATTELVMFAQLQDQFAQRNVKLLAVATQNTLVPGSSTEYRDHRDWVKDVNGISLVPMVFPFVSDSNGEIFHKYGLVDQEDINKLNADDTTASSIAFQSRTIVIIGPQKHVRIAFNYPAAVGINPAEVLRTVDCLQTAYDADVRLPANWVPGREVIIPKKINDKDAEKKFGEYNKMTPYLRFAPLPKEKTSVETIKTISEEARNQFLTTAA